MAAATVTSVTGYRELPAPPSLRSEAECRWRSVLPAGAAPRSTLVLPDGCMDLMWMDGELVVAGPDTVAHTVERRPGMVIHGLRLHPGVAPALLGVPADALRDQRVRLAELAPTAAARTTAAIADGISPAAALTELATRLRATNSGPEPALAAAAALLRRGGSVAGTAAELGWTVRSLHRRCAAGFGYGPAVLRRVLRFRRAVALARAGVPAADAAAETGYADQPHLSREVRALAGVPLGQLLAGPGEDDEEGRGANRSTPLPSGSCTVA